MKTRAIVICVILIVLSPFSCIGQNENILVLSCGSKAESHLAVVITPVLRKALEQLGYSLEIMYNPSPRSLLYSNSGVVDGEVHRVANFHEVSNGGYPNLYRINSPVATVYLSAFSLNELIRINDYSDLKHYSVAFMRGKKIYERSLSYYVSQDRLFPTATEEEAFQMLAKGLVDIVIAEKVNGMKIISRNKSFSSIGTATVLEEKEIHAYLNRKYQKLADQISDVLDKMKNNGSFQQISENAFKTFTSSE